MNNEYPTATIEIAEGVTIHPHRTPEFNLYVGSYKEADRQSHCVLFYYKESLFGTYGKLKFLEKQPIPEEDAPKYLAKDVEEYGIDKVMGWVYFQCEAEQLKM